MAETVEREHCSLINWLAQQMKPRGSVFSLKPILFQKQHLRAYAGEQLRNVDLPPRSATTSLNTFNKPQLDLGK